MKRIFFLAATASILITQTGCFGSFSLVKEVYEFNDSASDNKVVKTLLFWVLTIIPVYQVSAIIDAAILNLIEFWTGTNPLAMNEGDCEEQFVKMNGESYSILVTKNNMKFSKIIDGVKHEVGQMAFEESDNSWAYLKDGVSNKVVSYDAASDLVTFNLGDQVKVMSTETLAKLEMQENKCSYDLAFN